MSDERPTASDEAPRRRGNPGMRPGAPSVNPSGRPKGAAGLAKYIAEQTNGGRELIDRLLGIVRDEDAPIREVTGALAMLLDRFVGKPLATTEVLALARVEHATVGLPAGWASFSPEQRRSFLDDVEARAIAAAKPANALAVALAIGSNADE
jgi:hypothetical protein